MLLEQDEQALHQDLLTDQMIKNTILETMAYKEP